MCLLKCISMIMYKNSGTIMTMSMRIFFFVAKFKHQTYYYYFYYYYLSELKYNNPRSFDLVGCFC